MSKLSDLRSKGETVVLSDGTEIELTPITLSEEAVIAEMQDNDESFKAISYLVKQSVKRAVPDATDEEIEQLNKEDLRKITEAVLQVNKLVSPKPEGESESSTDSPSQKK